MSDNIVHGVNLDDLDDGVLISFSEVCTNFWGDIDNFPMSSEMIEYIEESHQLLKDEIELRTKLGR